MTTFATAPRPIRRILVANRGEIACRIMRTCRRLGVSNVAVYSDADANALHVRQADAALRIGPPAVGASYLNVAAMIGAARESGADAVHPGYGFLSENAAFARACEEAGLVFIGPSADVIAAMGSKIEAKKLADAAGVPTVAGYLGADQTVERLANEAKRIGFPLLIKASAGGGGRGMRRVDCMEQFAEALQSARAEARSAFGDDKVLLEKLVPHPRHIEVQLIGDGKGTLLHLFERDCSIQRKNQKVFEESPAPHLSDVARTKLYDRAIRLGRAIGYTSAGTVEFVMEAGSDEPLFLEMNTRLQVEHPVTEEVTGIDLIEWQIRVAAGLALPASQADIRARGHAIEARIATERPDRAFQPATGRIVGLKTPRGARFDTGVDEGSEISLHYDSMVAKLIVHGEDRATAVANLGKALAETAVLGVATNIGMLRDVVARPAFVRGGMTTDFLEAEFPGGWSPGATSLRELRGLAAIHWARCNVGGDASPWLRRSGFRVTGERRSAQAELLVRDDGSETAVVIGVDARGYRAMFADGNDVVWHERAASSVQEDRIVVALNGLTLDAHVGFATDEAGSSAVEAASDNILIAPLPGIIAALLADAGASVAKGDSLAQIEAMKLVHTLKASIDGRIGRIHVAVGDTVSAGAALIEIVPLEQE
ncbi:biotin carboxylase N-terminal domain-containing protein [Bradyrhizobium sp. LHD-71]|uniref:acetyl/propionyl/methylcrotonyl-CoA carboxylase subunit alpha n=1 Tax=Bradyrhizobium sp. LHD-71 TaxID=3072141 RepID=UPI00280D206F|nr:biotin carboxylase N-terminal domain-containing protein [Bradyrhizobium sp. LHD-71]MDQ8727457.1 biotin carboxylase N-terminal domain-containing protein [Bradyrhizobium sp. LHD-71]